VKHRLDGAVSLAEKSLPNLHCRADFSEIEALGHGAFSRVLRVKHRLDGMEYALKRSLQEVTNNAKKRLWIQVGWDRRIQGNCDENIQVLG